MAIPPRKLIRIAERMRQQLLLLRASRYGEVTRRTHHLIEDLGPLRGVSDLLAICLGRNWNAGASQMAGRIVQSLQDLPYRAGEIVRMAESVRKIELPPVGEIMADLQQAQEEFEGFKYVEDGDLLVVTTEAIELEGRYLGEFEIRLHVGSLGEIRRHSCGYRIVALDPHPAACNESVTHPHISDEHLCEGDASAAIEAALSNGRICDFFQLVHAVLSNYNPNSPYMALSGWDGQPCRDCGCTMGPDDSHWCSSCEEEFCDECSSYCRRCDETTCRGCLEECRVCGDLVCSSCTTTCPDCGKRLCRKCLEEEECPCIQERPEQEQEDDRRNDESRGAAGSGGSPDRPNEQVGTEAA